MAIRYDRKLNQEINRVIRNFNQKIARLEKSEKDYLLPSKVGKKELKQSVRTRTDLRRELAKLQRFSTRGAEETITTTSGIDISKYEYSELRRETTRLKRILSREITTFGETTPTIFGKKQAGTFKEMGSVRLRNLEAKREALEKEIGNLNKEEFKRYKEYLGRLSHTVRNQEFKNSYYDMLFKLAYEYDYPQSKIDKIINKLDKLSPNQFDRFFNTEQSIKAVTDYYGEMLRVSSSKNASELYESLKADVHNLYDNIYENIDVIVSDY